MKKSTKIIASVFISAAVLSAGMITTVYAASVSERNINENDAAELNEAIISDGDISLYENVDLFAYADTVKEQDGKDYKAADHYGVNAKGETYGSGAWAADGTDLPDLLLVEMENGETGYIYSSELDPGSPESPELAEQWEKEHSGYVINVYESDGETVIGEFKTGD